jgi:hypothetical protein
MRRILVLAALLLIASSLLIAPHRSAAQNDPSTITYKVLSTDTRNLDLFRFTFQAKDSVPGPYPEPMMVYVTAGDFVLYLGIGASVIIDPPGTYQTMNPASVDQVNDSWVIGFDDNSLGEQFECEGKCRLRVPDAGTPVAHFPAGGDVLLDSANGTTNLGDVGIRLPAGTVIYLPGPTFCFICNFGDDPGVLEVSAVTNGNATGFSWVAYATPEESALAPSEDVSLARGGAPESLKAVFLPARHPGSCSGKVQ